MFDVMGQVTEIGMENVETFGVMRQVTDTGMENVENLETKVMNSLLIYGNVQCHGTSF